MKKTDLDNIQVLILAAGIGKRMNSSLPKVLAALHGQPLIAHVLDKIPSQIDDTIIIIGHKGEFVIEALKTRADYANLQFLWQNPPQGTGDAVRIAKDALDKEHVLILYGDVPLLSTQTILHLINSHLDKQAIGTIITFFPTDPHGYGRIIRNGKNEIIDITEEKDATPEQKAIKEVNSGIGIFNRKLLMEQVLQLTNDNTAKEYYLTEAISNLARMHGKLHSINPLDDCEVNGINTVQQLLDLERTESSHGQQLWAPWRMAFLEAPKVEGCLFCTLGEANPENDRENLILARGKECLVMMNRFPYASGHVMIMPYQHRPNLQDITVAEMQEILIFLQKTEHALKTIWHPHGFNVGLNIGRAAGAGILDHIHFHVVPRWIGDTNFMPLFTDVKVFPEYLLSTYDKLVKEF